MGLAWWKSIDYRDKPDLECRHVNRSRGPIAWKPKFTYFSSPETNSKCINHLPDTLHLKAYALKPSAALCLCFAAFGNNYHIKHSRQGSPQIAFSVIAAYLANPIQPRSQNKLGNLRVRTSLQQLSFNISSDSDSRIYTPYTTSSPFYTTAQRRIRS